MNTFTNCTKCGSDQTQTFAMANKTGSSSGFAIGLATGGQVAGGFGRQKTEIAKLTQPPKKETDTGSGIAFIFIAIFIFNFVGAPLSMLFASILGRENWDLTSWLAGMFIGLVAAIVFVVLARKHTDGQKPRLRPPTKPL